MQRPIVAVAMSVMMAAVVLPTTSSVRSGQATVTPQAVPVTPSPVQETLARNTTLAENLRVRLPAGMDLMIAADGFDSLSQFVSAVQASYREGLPFEELKHRIVSQHMSLGQAMRDMR